MENRRLKWVNFFLVALGLAIVPGVAGFAPAQATLKLCNETSYMLETAVAHKTGSKWRVEGWWTIQPGKCETVIKGEMKKDDYYTFARSISGHTGGQKAWGGHFAFCTGEGTFSITSDGNCESGGYTQYGFARIDHKSESSWSTTFTEPSGYSAKKARIAGIQRLLKDLGYPRISIDGFMGKRTRISITKFKKQNKMPKGDFLTADLFDAMARQANLQSRKSGFQMCNETSHTLYAAFASRKKKKDNLVSKGWYQIPSGQCKQITKDKLGKGDYFTYAEVVLEDGTLLQWGGQSDLCTNNIRFAIDGSSDCAIRGYDSRPFRKIDTESKDHWKTFFTFENMSGGAEESQAAATN